MESLAADLRDRALFRVVDRADIAEFSVLKTYDPPLSALHGAVLTDVTRHGKFLDLVTRPAGAAQPGAGQSGCGPGPAPGRCT